MYGVCVLVCVSRWEVGCKNRGTVARLGGIAAAQAPKAGQRLCRRRQATQGLAAHLHGPHGVVVGVAVDADEVDCGAVTAAAAVQRGRGQLRCEACTCSRGARCGWYCSCQQAETPGKRSTCGSSSSDGTWPGNAAACKQRASQPHNACGMEQHGQHHTHLGCRQSLADWAELLPTRRPPQRPTTSPAPAKRRMAATPQL